MKTFDLSRRSFLGAALTAPLFVGSAFALSTGTSQKLVSAAIDDVNRAINSGKSSNALYADFERLFKNYADLNIIAAQSLGPPWRSLSGSERAAYIDAFSGYISRKYGKRFREFVGSDIKVGKARQVKSFVVVSSTVKLRGSSAFQVDWQVSDRSGAHKIVNLVIEGISMIKTEREDINALYARNGRKIGGLISALKKAG